MIRLLGALRGRLDQRFEDPIEEEAFRRSAERSRLIFTSIVPVVACVYLLFYDVPFIISEMQQEVDPLVASVWDPRWFCVVLSVLVIVTSIVVIATGCMTQFCGELVVVVVFLALGLRIALGKRHNVIVWASRMGAVWPQRAHADDATALLGFVSGVTALALSACIRVHRLAPLLAISFLYWVTATAVFGSTIEEGGNFTLVLLFILMAFALSGAARTEAFVRKEWRQQLRIMEQEQQLSTQSALAASMQSIAERLCDLVIFLDAKLCVVSNAVPMNAFFGRAVFGHDFLEVVAESDRNTLQQAFDRASETQVPQCLPVTVVFAEDCRRTAHLLIASTGAASPKYLVGLCAEAAGLTPEAEIHDDVAKALEAQSVPPTTADNDHGSTRTGLIFQSMDLEQIASLGREEQWWIDPEDLRVPTPACVLGEGGFGLVAAASYRGQSVAVKISRCGKSRLQGALMELRVLRRFRHPNVVLLHGALFAGNGSIALVYELLSGMQLDILLERRPDITRNGRFQVLYAISSAMTCLHLHLPSIVHGDIKPQNIMVQEMRMGFVPKLLDFGLSKFHGRDAGKQGGTLAWRAPETFEAHASASTASDVFAFGWLAQYVVGGFEPHDGLRGPDLRRRVQTMVAQGESPEAFLPEEAPFRVECQALCRGCLQYDPQRRPRMADVQVAISGWVTEDVFCRLGVAAVTRALRQEEWRIGSGFLHPLVGARQLEPEAKLLLDVSDEFRVTHIDPDGSELPLPVVGDSLLDWLEDPVGFRILVLATLAELRAGAKVPPLWQTLSGVRWKPPGASECAVRFRMTIPNFSGTVKLRVAPLPVVERDQVCHL